MARRNREYVEFLKEKFNEQKYIEFINDLLNLSHEDINTSIVELVPHQKQFKETIEYYKFIANYTTNSDKIGIFIVKLSTEISQNARTAQRSFISTLLSKYNLDASIVAFYQDNESSWRLSFVKKELSFTETGIKVDLSPAKRYSYLVGENEAVHTAQEYLFKLFEIEDRKITLSDIEKVFDVEKVTKKFFEEYKEKYLKLKEYLDSNEDFITESRNCDFTSEEFAKKLMGQIVFLYFLQKKGWLGVQLAPNELSINEYDELLNSNDSVSNNLIKLFYELKEDIYVIDKNKLRSAEVHDITNFSNIFIKTKYNMPWGTGRKDFIRTIYKQAIKEHKNFFDSYVEQFFYNGLNEKRDNQYFALFNCKIPFLNGGLFEPLNNYRWSSSRFSIPNDMFSNDEKNGILDFLDLYNFTIDEEEPLEKEIAVDPEMLGKIFENLLDVKDRKSKGAFYTPREIVHYMCQESLANYLVNKVGVDYNEIIQFIKYGDLISQIDWESALDNKESHQLGNTIYNKIVEIDKALMNVKVADPAVGSGAFPLGILNEIVKLRNNLTTYMLIQSELGQLNLDLIIDSEQRKRDIYDMKLQTIENCIYAVDVENSAIDIAKLRLWLSLIVDYPNVEEPKPLPNLDCKIMQGNSLLDEFEGVPLFSRKILKNSMRKNASKVHVQQNMFGEVADIHIQQSLNFDSNDIDFDKYIEEMLLLQKQYFSTSDNKLKKVLKQKIEKIQLDMVEETLKNDKLKLEKFKSESSKKQKPWFIWELEFYDVFKDNGGFDIVIGNPPYVDSEHMMKTQDGVELRKACTQKYKTAKGNWDLFVIFVELGFKLATDKGILSLIIPNKIVSANYSKTLRTYMLEKSLIEIRDYSNVNVFKSASVYPVTLLASNHSKKSNVIMRVMESMDNIAWTNEIAAKRFYNSINWDTYFSKSNEYTFLIDKIDNNLRLKDYNFIVKGAATVNEAYLMKEMLKDNLLTEKYFKFVNTGTIDQYKCLWGIKPTQYIKAKYDKPIIIDEHLRKMMQSRYEDAKKEKIIIGGMTKIIEAILDKGEIVAAKSTIEVFGGDFDKRILLAILNSKLMTFYYRLYYNSSSLEGGFYSINREQIENLPIKYIEDNNYEQLYFMIEKYIIDYDMNIKNEIDNYIYDLYGLTNEERKIINNYFITNSLFKD